MIYEFLRQSHLSVVGKRRDGGEGRKKTSLDFLRVGMSKGEEPASIGRRTDLMGAARANCKIGVGETRVDLRRSRESGRGRFHTGRTVVRILISPLSIAGLLYTSLGSSVIKGINKRGMSLKGKTRGGNEGGEARRSVAKRSGYVYPR